MGPGDGSKGSSSGGAAECTWLVGQGWLGTLPPVDGSAGLISVPRANNGRHSRAQAVVFGSSRDFGWPKSILIAMCGGQWYEGFAATRLSAAKLLGWSVQAGR